MDYEVDLDALRFEKRDTEYGPMYDVLDEEKRRVAIVELRKKTDRYVCFEVSGADDIVEVTIPAECYSRDDVARLLHIAAAFVRKVKP
jgi:hypothetical protein